MRAASLCCLLLVTAASAVRLSAQAAAAPTYVISGLVVRAKQPLKHVQVTISQVDHPDRKASLMTAEDGSFKFVSVPANKYSLSAEYRGEERTYQQNEGYSTAVVTGPGLDSEHLVFDLPPVATIAVKVMDDEGDPAPQCQLYLFHRAVLGGWPKMLMRMSGMTDSSGEHRFTELEPGTYYLAVSGRPWYANRGSMLFFGQNGGAPTSEAELDMAFPLTYYPSSLDPGSAAPLNVAAGAPLPVQFTLHAVPAVHVTANEPDGQRNGRKHSGFVVEATGPAGIPIRIYSQMQVFNGQETIAGLAPGDYRISTLRMNPESGAPRRRDVVSSVEMHLTGDVNATAELAQGGAIRVSGRLSMEGAQVPEELAVLLSAIENGQSSVCPVKSDGEFSCGNRTMAAGMIPGRYTIRLANTTDLYLKAVTSKGAEFAGGLLDLRTATTAELSLTAARGLTKLAGIVLQNGRPAAGAMVLLVPQDANPALYIPRDQSDSDGTFTLPDVHPGRYSLLALDDGHDLAYQDRTVLRTYMTHARSVDVPLAGDAPLQVELQKR